LDHAAHGAGAQPRVVTHLYELRDGFGRKVDSDFLVGEGFIYLPNHQAHNLAEFFGLERAEEYDFIEAVEEFGAEGAGVDEVIGELLLEILELFAGFDALANFVRAVRFKNGIAFKNVV
jgi:hypothetical protein